MIAALLLSGAWRGPGSTHWNPGANRVGEAEADLTVQSGGQWSDAEDRGPESRGVSLAESLKLNHQTDRLCVLHDSLHLTYMYMCPSW